MTPVFLDTVGLIALYDVDDQWHMAAVPIYKQLVRSAQRAVTTSLVLYECGNAASRGPHRPAVDELRQLMAESGDLIEPTPGEIESAWANYTRGVAGSAGIVDHVSFVVMRRLGITEAFTNDRHFTAAGFRVLF